MYIIENKKNKYKLVDKKALSSIEGYTFGRKTHKIANVQVNNLVLCNKKIIHPIVKKQVDKKYQKLISLLTELLISDDETGEALREALNQIEKFRQIIKNKYRDYLTRKDLEVMSKQLSIVQKEANEKLLEINYVMQESKNKSTCR